MSNGVDGMVRLRGAGVGSIVGGIVLGVLSLLASYTVAAGVVLALGVLALGYERRSELGFDSRPSIGIAAIGGIGLLEAFGVGIGVGPLLLAGFAIGAGVLDIFLGSLFGRLRGRTNTDGGESNTGK